MTHLAANRWERRCEANVSALANAFHSSTSPDHYLYDGDPIDGDDHEDHDNDVDEEAEEEK